jgi:hypothetical protein
MRLLRAGTILVMAMPMLVPWRAVAQVNARPFPAAGPETTETSAPVLDETGASDADMQITSDTHPLSGGLRSGLGSWGPRHSFTVPGFRLGQSLESNPMLADPGAYRGFTSATGQLQAIQYLGRGGELRYAGAVRFDSSATLRGANRFTNSHGVSFAESFRPGSWNFMVIDEAHYWQGSLAGDAGLEGMGSIVTQASRWGGVPGIQLGSVEMQSGLQPDQSILSVRSARISNTVLAELDRRVGQRNTITAAAFYGLLHFYTPGLIDDDQKGLFAGFDHALSPSDRVGVMYGYSRLGFPGVPDTFSNSYAQLMYGRSLSGRLAVEVGAGPQHISSSGTSTGYSDLNWQGRGSVNYQLRNLGIQVAATRSFTGGAGSLYGARTNGVQSSVTHAFNRIYSASLTFGITRNTAILAGQHYDTQHAGASLSRNAGSRFGTYFSYDLQNQTSSGCSASGCALTGLWQIFGMGISWGARPIGLP